MGDRIHSQQGRIALTADGNTRRIITDSVNLRSVCAHFLGDLLTVYYLPDISIYLYASVYSLIWITIHN